MRKTILVTVEYGKDGTYSCYSETPIGDYALVDGDGKNVQEAKADFLRAVEECREAYPDDKRYNGLSFEYKYDLRSFFNYFSFLNVSDIAKRAGINPSLMRQYTSGVKTASEKTYERLSSCIEQIKAELHAASF
ncbi:pilus assembly protein HicB [Prevotella ihumii]|uniref:pilus assembly protein HicB n=1 Tax=Prevotella ihumii TaxID=1917878 RepID=UPI000981A55E|nr:pilus assembly protein HicB [Prevotella ihumii]